MQFFNLYHFVNRVFQSSLTGNPQTTQPKPVPDEVAPIIPVSSDWFHSFCVHSLAVDFQKVRHHVPLSKYLVNMRLRLQYFVGPTAGLSGICVYSLSTEFKLQLLTQSAMFRTCDCNVYRVVQVRVRNQTPYFYLSVFRSTRTVKAHPPIGLYCIS